MKVRVSYTVDVDDEYRRAINAFYGKPGLATRSEVVQWLQSFGDSMDADLDYSNPEPDDGSSLRRPLSGGYDEREGTP